ncbi:hypothetical protein BXZ70DRAFT_944980 [Cristinia sonorae]|uniref:Uncharacterized protein n=1 Tax=Cristinia sonorae TaxID=1940300 RepID=A0A8K0UKJ2_9AGAR|nr:hypothetical protein BXZ70DRAFT_944980 [Cristinia sonorae]
MRILYYPTQPDMPSLSVAHPPTRPGLVRQPRLEPQSHDTDNDDDHWMDDLEQHIVSSLQAEVDNDEGMDVVDIKPSVPTHTESIPVFSPPSPPPPSPELAAEEADDEEEEDDDDEDMVDAYCPSQTSSPTHHHGYSRSALHNLKEFWSCRHDEWVKLNAYTTRTSSRAYDGIVRPSLKLDISTFNNTPNETSASPSPSPSPSSPDPNSPIFPRSGELARLRDPRPALVDRAFSHIPLYSISKIVFAHEIARARSPSSASSSSEDADVSVYSDDSTLVDEETSSSAQAGTAKKGVPPSPPVDWYERWKLVASKLHPESPVSFDPPPTAFSWADEVARASGERPKSPKARKFFFALDEDDFSDREFDEEEEEDYGIELARSRSSFSVGVGVGVGVPEGDYGWGREYVSDFEMLF